MAGIFSLVFLVITSKCLLADGAESFPSDEASFDTSSVGLTAKNNCSAPKPVASGSTLKWRSGVSNQSVFLPGEKAEFVCKEGFRQIGWLQTLTCQSNGTWTSSSSDIEEDFKSSERAFGEYFIWDTISGHKHTVCFYGRLRQIQPFLVLYRVFDNAL